MHPEVPEGNSELIAGGQTKGRRTTSRTTQKVGPQKDDVVVGSLWKPYSSSFFLPGKVMGRPVQFLIDTGCTSNLLSRHVFDRLPTEMKNRLQERTDHGMMADGSPLEFYGLLTLPVRIRSVQVTVSLIVCPLQEDAILGMPFLMDQHCEINFQYPVVTVNGQKLACTDREGRPLSSKVQVVRTTVLPPRSEVIVTCRLTTRSYQPLGMVEGAGDQCIVAASLHQPDEKGRVALRCMNLAEHPVDVAAGSVIGCYTGIQDADIGRPWRESDPKEVQRPQVGLSKVEVPLHMEELYKQTTSHCKTEHDRQQVATLLCKYSNVFSQGEEDVGLTELVQHEVPTLPNTQPIRQAPYRVGPEKEAEIDRQVSKLARQGMIEPTYGAWSSPVVLVRKDQTWRLCVDYRKLNAVTKQDAYPLPRIDDSLDALFGSKLFSTLDMMSGYWQVPLSPEAQEKAAFITRNGLWR